MSDKSVEDRRVQKTKMALWSALLDLIKEEEWADINVRGICEEADVARSTFYLHFQNKLELLDYGFASGEAHLSDTLKSMDSEHSLEALLSWLVDHLYSEHVQFQQFKGFANPAIFDRFKKSIANLLREQLLRQYPNMTNHQCLFIAGGIFAILEDWLFNNAEIAKNAMVADLLHDIEAFLDN